MKMGIFRLFGVHLLFLFLVHCDASATQRQKRGIFSLDSGDSCLGTDRLTRGVCLNRPECRRQGGKVAGYCGVFSTCCALETCDIVTRAKDATFSNPPLTNMATGLACSYNVDINNPRVCQIRIDYDILSLSQPTLDPGTVGGRILKKSTKGDQEKGGLNKDQANPGQEQGAGDDRDETEGGEESQSGSRKSRAVSNLFGYSCRDDVLEVTNLQGFSEIVPPICGENSGQHVYLRVNASINSRALRINLKIADRTSRTDLSIPSWRIRITQLECYNTLGLQNKPSYLQLITNNSPVRPFLGYLSQIDGRTERLVGEESEQEQHPETKNTRQKRQLEGTAANDDYLIAPAGCLQYYPDRAGTFESFNYNGGKGHYLSNLRYATCFRRSVDVCGIKYTASFFQLASAASANNYLDVDCEKNPYVVNNLDDQDFLFIADGQTADGRRGSKWCGPSAANSIVASSPPGPLYVFFNSDNFVNTATDELGYRINYNVLNNC